MAIEPQHPTWVPVGVLAATFSIQLLAKWPGKTAEDSSTLGVPPFTRETCTKLQAPGFSLSQP